MHSVGTVLEGWENLGWIAMEQPHTTSKPELQAGQSHPSARHTAGQMEESTKMHGAALWEVEAWLQAAIH